MFNFLKKSDGSTSNARKRQGYFLEWDGTVSEGESAPEPTAATAPTEPVAPVVTTPPVSEVKQASESLAPAAEAPKEEAPKRVKKFRGQAPEQVVEVPTQTAEGVKATPTKVAVPATPAAVPTFAPNFLLPKPGQTPRRRPGANMTSYLDMAKQMQK